VLGSFLAVSILAAIAIPVFNAAKANAQSKSCQANQRTIEGAAQTYSASNNGTLPGDGLLATSGLIGQYIKVDPKCPSNFSGGGLYWMAAGTVTGDTGVAGAAILTAAGTAYTTSTHPHF